MEAHKIYIHSWKGRALEVSVSGVVIPMQGSHADQLSLSPAYIVVGEEKHVGTQDPLRGSSKIRLGTSVKQCLAEWGYAWNESAGVICVDPCRV